MRIFLTRLPFAILTLLVLASGSGAALGDAYRYQYKGEGMDASFQFQDTSGCIFTSVQVSATSDSEHGTVTDPTSRPVGYVSLYRIDSCAGNRLLLNAVAYGEFDPADFTIQGHLASAAFHTLFPAYDSVSGKTRTIEIDLTWTATDRTYQIFSRHKILRPDYRINGRVHEMDRPAQAAGRLLLDSEEMILEPTGDASIDDFRQGVFEVNDWRTMP